MWRKRRKSEVNILYTIRLFKPWMRKSPRHAKSPTHPFDDACSNPSDKPFHAFRPQRREGERRSRFLGSKQSNAFQQSAFQGAQILLEEIEKPFQFACLPTMLNVPVPAQTFFMF